MIARYQKVGGSIPPAGSQLYVELSTQEAERFKKITGYVI
jgi:hypothetical protein